jgi:hypothetical protein
VPLPRLQRNAGTQAIVDSGIACRSGRRGRCSRAIEARLDAAKT